jgi:hypothetical protein
MSTPHEPDPVNRWATEHYGFPGQTATAGGVPGHGHAGRAGERSQERRTQYLQDTPAASSPS